MFNRSIKPLTSNSFFLFGARGTGKSTFIQHYLKDKSVSFDLLNDEIFDRLMVQPKTIEEICESRKFEWVVIDEVQRLPKLLNLVHRMIEKTGQKFALTGSSSRKLKRGGANLLAGRAFVNTLFPLTSLECGESFNLLPSLRWGTLPKIFNLKSDEEKRAYLRSYCLTYIKEEIQIEQVVRKLEPFREFLPVAAQSMGKVINFTSISREIGAHVPTVQTYFQILEDTYLGFLLPHFHRSVRKSQTEAPKFYFFDNGVQKALEGSLDSPPVEGTSNFGVLFESFLIQEIFRLNHYCERDFRLSFFRTKNGAEIDLILSKGKKDFLIEIKSSTSVNEVQVEKLARQIDIFGPNTQAFYLSRDENERTLSRVKCMHWSSFLKIFPSLK